MINKKDLTYKDNKFYLKKKKYSGIATDEANNIFYFKDGKYHREDGPAKIFYNGYQSWFKNGKLHREDGPAAEYSNGYREWHYNGKEISCKTNEEFIKIIKLKLFW